MPGLATDRWRHLKPPDWRQIESQYHGVARCAIAWRSIVEIALGDFQDVPRLEVRYEKLLCDPVGTAVRVLNYLGLDDDGSVFEFARLIQDETANSYHAAPSVRMVSQQPCSSGGSLAGESFLRSAAGGACIHHADAEKARL